MPMGTLTNDDVDTLESLGEIDTKDAIELFLTFTTTVDLTDFEVQARPHPSSEYVTVASASGDFTTPVSPVLKASGNLNVAATGSVHYLKLDVGAFQHVRLRGASTNAVVNIWWFTLAPK